MLHFDNYITLGDALLITLISLVVVFVVLGAIALIITFLGKVFQEQPKQVAETVATKPVVQQATATTRVNLNEVMSDEHKRIAALVATIAANENDEDVKYRVTSIKEI